jgi:hypothetical protein
MERSFALLWHWTEVGKLISPGHDHGTKKLCLMSDCDGSARSGRLMLDFAVLPLRATCAAACSVTWAGNQNAAAIGRWRRLHFVQLRSFAARLAG